MELNIEKMLDEALEASKNGEHKVVSLVTEPGAGKTKKVLAWSEDKGVVLCRLSIDMYKLLEMLDKDNIVAYFAALEKDNVVLFLDDVEKMPAKVNEFLNSGKLETDKFLFTVKAETVR
ncbi:MAG: hypothetical protein Q4B60_08540 [Erysipelotrichaceae bacterium]|nr:hypothetical protein [Erysipelotrichaceae bacterium]